MWFDIVSWLNVRRSSTKKQSVKYRRRRQLGLEHLEERRLLSASSSASSDLMGQLNAMLNSMVAATSTHSGSNGNTAAATNTAPTITQPSNTTAAVGVAFTDQIVATGTPAVKFSLGTHPDGMTVNSTTGLISWTPTTSETGVQNVTVKATNSAGNASASFTITVPAVKAPTITQPANTTAVVGVTFTDQIVATGTPAPTFTLAAGPTGMTIDNKSGLISWTPTVAQVGTQTVKVTATNVAGSSTKSFTVTVPNTSPVLTQPADTTAIVGQAFTDQIVATGKPAPSFALTSAPNGMTIDGVTGLIAWTPTATEYGTFTVTVAATNPSGTSSKTFHVAVPNPAPVFTSSATLPQAFDGAAYTATISATATVAPGSPAPTFSIVSGPTGLTIDPVTGVINWTPIAAQNGVQTVVVKATNFAGSTTQSFTIDAEADTTPPAAPTVTLGDISTSSITLNWTASTDNVGVAGYRVYDYTPPVYKGVYAGRGSSRQVLVTPAHYTLIADNLTSTSYTVNGLQPGTTHQYVVAAFDAAGNQSAYSAPAGAETWLLPSVTWSTNGSNTDPQVSVTANHSLYMTIWPAGNPSPTFTLYSAPAGVVFSPAVWTNSQLTSSPATITWTPTADEVGVDSIVFQSVSAAGTTYTTIPVTVVADAPIPTLSVDGGLTYSLGNYSQSNAPFNYQLTLNPGFNSSGTSPQYALAGTPFNFQIGSVTNTSGTTYALLSGPAGMTIDANTGIGTWNPTQTDAGNTSVTIASTNSAGTSLLTFTFPTYFTASPTSVGIDYFTSTPSTTSAAPSINPTVVWTPPADTTGIAGYQITATTALTGVTTVFNSSGLGTSLTMTGLAPNSQYFVSVAAYDASGNLGISNSTGQLYTGIVPSVNWSLSSPDAVVGNPLSVQFQTTNGYSLFYALASGPAGAMINPTTGQLTWTPTTSDLGTATFVVDATSGWGTLVMTVSVPVYFADAPTVTVVSGTDPVTGNPTLTANWSPPTANLASVVEYQVTVVDANAPAGSPPTVVVLPATTLSLSLSNLGITAGTIQVAAIDALGDLSDRSAWVVV